MPITRIGNANSVGQIFNPEGRSCDAFSPKRTNNSERSSGECPSEVMKGLRRRRI